MERITINTQDAIKAILPDVLEKDLMKNQAICPVCYGLGVKLWHNAFRVDEDETQHIQPGRFPYHQHSLLPCPNCYNGVINVCQYCGKPLEKGRLKCTCDAQKEQDEREYAVQYEEIIKKAKEILLDDANVFFFDEKSSKFFSDKDEFVEYWYDEYLNSHMTSINPSKTFEEFFETTIPKIVWNTEEINMTMDADSIIEEACEDLHEDALESISYEDRKELQELLDAWCKKQVDTQTYVPCYQEYIRVTAQWFTT